MIDSDLFMPKKGWDDPDRRKKAEIPESLVHRPKYDIALEQLQRALANGLDFGWVTADSWYGQKPAFIEGLEALGLRFVLEIPKNLMGWVQEPKDAQVKRGEVQNLVRWSRPMLRQEWVEFHIKDTGMGPMVWEAKAAPFWMERDGRVVGPYWLVAVRDVRDRDTIKYFLCNAAAGVPMEVILHVGFSRWPVERTLEDEKSELGLSHFEVRKYPGVLRHLRITQVSHLFLARQTRRLRKKKSGGHHLPGPRRGQHDDRRLDPQRAGSASAAGASGRDYSPDTENERRIARIARQGSQREASGDAHSRGGTALLHPAVTAVAL
jgi:SRSO17 transposase